MRHDAFHEEYRRDDEVEGGSDRSFGLLVGGILVVIGLARGLFGSGTGGVTWLLIGIGVALVGAALLRPAALAPLNRLWTRLAILLYHVVNPVMMAAMFFVAVVPTGLVMRALGRDPLQLRFDRAAASYWIERRPPGPAPESMKLQF